MLWKHVSVNSPGQNTSLCTSTHFHFEHRFGTWTFANASSLAGLTAELSIWMDSNNSS